MDAFSQPGKLRNFSRKLVLYSKKNIREKDKGFFFFNDGEEKLLKLNTQNRCRNSLPPLQYRDIIPP